MTTRRGLFGLLAGAVALPAVGVASPARGSLLPLVYGAPRVLMRVEYWYGPMAKLSAEELDHARAS
jgi:hypothetical protein